jgi:hypothetical protein
MKLRMRRHFVALQVVVYGKDRKLIHSLDGLTAATSSLEVDAAGRLYVGEGEQLTVWVRSCWASSSSAHPAQQFGLASSCLKAQTLEWLFRMRFDAAGGLGAVLGGGCTAGDAARLFERQRPGRAPLSGRRGDAVRGRRLCTRRKIVCQTCGWRRVAAGVDGACVTVMTSRRSATTVPRCLGSRSPAAPLNFPHALCSHPCPCWFGSTGS